MNQWFNPANGSQLLFAQVGTAVFCTLVVCAVNHRQHAATRRTLREVKEEIERMNESYNRMLSGIITGGYDPSQFEDGDGDGDDEVVSTGSTLVNPTGYSYRNSNGEITTGSLRRRQEASRRNADDWKRAMEEMFIARA